MMLEPIKKLVIDNVGVPNKFRYNGVRNQIEEFDGVILNAYPAIFTILLSDSSVRSFSYTDILVKNLEIIH